MDQLFLREDISNKIHSILSENDWQDAWQKAPEFLPIFARLSPTYRQLYGETKNLKIVLGRGEIHGVNRVKNDNQAQAIYAEIEVFISCVLKYLNNEKQDDDYLQARKQELKTCLETLATAYIPRHVKSWEFRRV